MPDKDDDKALARVIVVITALAFKLRYKDVLDQSVRGEHTIFLRQLSMYLLNTSFNFNKSRIGRIFKKDRTTVAYACQQIEDKRDSAKFNDQLDKLEDTLHALIPLMVEWS